MDRHKDSTSHEATPSDSRREKAPYNDPAGEDVAGTPNPPRTSTERMTSPKFGSAGSGGAELEPGPERD